MFRQIIKKIQNKRWLTLCLILGLSFLVATLCCHPMFEAGSLDKLVQDLNYEYIQANNAYPTQLGAEKSVKGGVFKSSDDVLVDMKEKEDRWDAAIGLPEIATQEYMNFQRLGADSTYGIRSYTYTVTYMPELMEHAQIVYGESLEEYQGDAIPCLASDAVLDKFEVMVGEYLEFDDFKNSSGKKLKLQIVGVVQTKDLYDPFWMTQFSSMPSNLFISKEAFDTIAKEYDYDFIFYYLNKVYDYRAIDYSNAEDVARGVISLSKTEEKFMETFSPVLKEYTQGKQTVGVTLWVLEIPIIGLVLTYIFMVASQIVDTEKSEIAMLKSRGISRFQIIRMYLLQSVILSGGGLLVGLPLGYILCKIGAATTDFLSFAPDDLYLYTAVWQMIPYGLAAVVIGIIFILIPVITSSGISIVQAKNSDKINKKPIWEKFFFDIILLAVSIYLLVVFSRSIEELRVNALSGTKMDPTIFMDSVLFILALGLFVLRLIHYLVIGVYKLGRKKWKPAVYASFLQITRTFNRQGIISVFLVLTVALGLFNANIARTINQNNEDRIVHENGADVVLDEQWEKKWYMEGKQVTDYEYVEPDYAKFDILVNSGVCESITRVINDRRAEVSFNVPSGTTNKNQKGVVQNCILQGINTKEFGETAILKDDFSREVHWYEHLNALAAEPNGVILSRNLAERLEVSVGEQVTLTRYCDVGVLENQERGSMKAKVCAIVDGWPGFNQYEYVGSEVIEQYLVVANFSAMYKICKASPYSIWMKLGDGKDVEDLQEVLSAMELSAPRIYSIDQDIDRMKNSTLIQITNGMFTLSFVIALVLCMAGFMIYWISSIRQRELLFGVYRAMGMSVKEINIMLVNEHIFSTFLSVLAGGVVGMISTFLFAKLFGVIYLPKKHSLDVFLHFEAGDMVKIGIVIVVMIVACIIVLRNIVKSLNITQALKLGED